MDTPKKLFYPNGLEATFTLMAGPNPKMAISILGKSGRLSGHSHEHIMGLEEATGFYDTLKESGWAVPVIMAEKSYQFTTNIVPIKEKLDLAYSNGIKNPKMSVIGFSFSRAKDMSRNPGFIYVKAGPKFQDTYYGKISPVGYFSPSKDFTPEVAHQLKAISEDVVEAAKAWGRATGTCSFCSRALTHASSVALSYGPICADKYGLPHDYESQLEAV